MELDYNQTYKSCLITPFLTNLTKFLNFSIKEARESYPITGRDRPLGLQVVEAPRILGSRHMKVVRWSALCTVCLYPPFNIHGTHFC